VGNNWKEPKELGNLHNVCCLMLSGMPEGGKKKKGAVSKAS